MIHAINHMSFTVQNLEKSVTFYKGLGLRLIDVSVRTGSFSEKATGVKGAQLNIAYLDAGNTMVELIQYTQSSGTNSHSNPNDAGSSHLCFEVDSIAAFLKAVKRFGGSVMSGPLKVPKGPNIGKKMGYVRDCEGNLLEYFGS